MPRGEKIRLLQYGERRGPESNEELRGGLLILQPPRLIQGAPCARHAAGEKLPRMSARQGLESNEELQGGLLRSPSVQVIRRHTVLNPALLGGFKSPVEVKCAHAVRETKNTLHSYDRTSNRTRSFGMNRFKSEEVNPRRTVRNPALIGGPTSSYGNGCKVIGLETDRVAKARKEKNKKKIDLTGRIIPSRPAIAAEPTISELE
ncbi:hypothetical protein B0H13DRAFT_1916536 [Mycena leptocephala]|nr:hypothetical protein B0H13DRAFT_1916536 [Mycena leptocephala]